MKIIVCGQRDGLETASTALLLRILRGCGATVTLAGTGRVTCTYRGVRRVYVLELDRTQPEQSPLRQALADVEAERATIQPGQ